MLKRLMLDPFLITLMATVLPAVRKVTGRCSFDANCHVDDHKLPRAIAWLALGWAAKAKNW